ncbi:MAG: hypothetical protein LBM13_04290 [Candidatus Ancillula sp.]|nr:hypothetical protein [Candidatus Ancillula sp.]
MKTVLRKSFSLLAILAMAIVCCGTTGFNYLNSANAKGSHSSSDSGKSHKQYATNGSDVFLATLSNQQKVEQFQQNSTSHLSGGNIYFGKDATNGNKPIKWRIVQTCSDAVSSGVKADPTCKSGQYTLTLMSEGLWGNGASHQVSSDKGYCFVGAKYQWNTASFKSCWSSSDLSVKLNSTSGFLKGFSSSELATIPVYSTDREQVNTTSSDANDLISLDKRVQIPSVNEMENSGVFNLSADGQRDVEINGQSVSYWLRSAGSDATESLDVVGGSVQTQYGEVVDLCGFTCNNNGKYDNMGVRPIIKTNLSGALFAETAGSDETGGENNANFKFVFANSSLTAPTAISPAGGSKGVVKEGEKMTVKMSKTAPALTGDKKAKYSVVIFNSSNKVVSIQHNISASQSFTVDTSTLSRVNGDTDYTMKIFSEEDNGGNFTNYATPYNKWSSIKVTVTNKEVLPTPDNLNINYFAEQFAGFDAKAKYSVNNGDCKYYTEADYDAEAETLGAVPSTNYTFIRCSEDTKAEIDSNSVLYQTPARPELPTIKTHDTSEPGADDGYITGVQTTMEYRYLGATKELARAAHGIVSDSNSEDSTPKQAEVWTPVTTNGELKDLAAGYYDFRVAVTNHNYVGDPVSVQVKEGVLPTCANGASDYPTCTPKPAVCKYNKALKANDPKCVKSAVIIDSKIPVAKPIPDKSGLTKTGVDSLPMIILLVLLLGAGVTFGGIGIYNRHKANLATEAKDLSKSDSE